MLQTGKTYRCKKPLDIKTRDVYILGRLPDTGSYQNYAVYHVDPVTKESEVGELEVHVDAVKDYEVVDE